MAGPLMAALILAALAPQARAQGEAKGYNCEDFGFEMGPLKIKGLQAPVYAQGDGDKVVVSDSAAGAIMSVPLAGGAATLSGKIKNPAGVAIAPDGFGSYAGQVFVLAPEGGDLKAPCAVDRVEQVGRALCLRQAAGGGKPQWGKGHRMPRPRVRGARESVCRQAVRGHQRQRDDLCNRFERQGARVRNLRQADPVGDQQHRVYIRDRRESGQRDARVDPAQNGGRTEGRAARYHR